MYISVASAEPTQPSEVAVAARSTLELLIGCITRSVEKNLTCPGNLGVVGVRMNISGSGIFFKVSNIISDL